ncbi:MAG: GDP-mannose 4,6-dehydratase [Candidatus Limnocylindria bacterium]
MRRAVITGGAGFIGSSLADRLLADGWNVTAYDSFDPFYPRERKWANLARPRESPNFQLIEGDTRDRETLRIALGEAKPDVVFDLAARAGVRSSIAQPGEYVDVNVRGLQNLLSEVASIGSRLVFASSSSIYGNDDRRPFTETQARGRPESPYGATKVAGEALVHAHHAVTGLSVGIARLFTVYGPRQRPDLAIHKFARSIIEGQPIELFDAGRGIRDYTYVEDVVDALVRLSSAEDPRLLVNVGSHRPVVTSEVVDELERALGRRAERQLLPAQPGDVDATYADVSLARERLGWEPKVAFRVGIERFCAWFLAEASGDQPA